MKGVGRLLCGGVGEACESDLQRCCIQHLVRLVLGVFLLHEY